MNRTTLLSACFLGLGLTACNEKLGVEPTVTNETEPNDTFATANNIGTLSDDGSSIDITADIEFDDGSNTDLEDHFQVLAAFSGNATVTVTQTDLAADMILVEELTESTDGATFDGNGIGVAEVGTIAVTENVLFRFRVECAAASTDYSISIQQAPAVSLETGETGPSAILIDPKTGEAQFETEGIELD